MKKVERAEDHEAPEQISEVVEEEEDGMLPGFRFHPTDEELVGFYLRRKVEKKRLSIEIIKEMDIYKHEPWDLPNQMMTTAGEKEWYFFCRRGRKYRNSVRPNRVTGCGFWKATGIDRPIHSSGHCIGLKKSLVYYRGHAGKGTKTDWMMHEFRLPVGCKSDAGNTAAAASKNAASMQLEAEVWTICRIFQRSASYKKQPNSYKTSTPTKSPPESSSVTNCVDPDEYMCCSSSGGGGDGSPVADLLQVEDYYQENIQSGHKQLDVAAGEWRSTMNGGGGGQYSDRSPPLCSSLHEQKPSWNDFERDIIWDWEELGRIEEFLADENFSLDSNRGYSYNKLGMDHAVS